MIDATEYDLRTILNLLVKHVPECEVRVFGSRVTWTAKDHSDLDLVVVGPEKLERRCVEKLKEAFEESSLPFVVDVMDWHRISSEFQKNIERSFHVIKTPASKKGNGWNYFKVSEFAEIVGGGTPKTGVPKYWNGNIPWITPKDLSNHKKRKISRGERNVSEEGFKNSSARLVPANTVLLTSRAPVGYLAIAQNELATNQGFRNLIVKDGYFPEFIYYLLLNNVDYLKQHASGSTFQELSGSTLKNLEFQLPDYVTQKKIAKILSDLDEKIELNQQMNKTLEATGQALFKRWFVDFEFPDEEGNPYKSSGGEMVDSELGEMPKGWKMSTIGENFKTILGGTPSTGKEQYWTGGKIPWINSGKVNEFRVAAPTEYITQEALGNSATKMMPKGTTILAITGATLGQVSRIEIDTCANQSVVGVIENETIPSEYIYFWIKDKIGKLVSHQTGGAQQHINKNNVNALELLIPPEDTIDTFRILIQAIFRKISVSCFESENLSNIRDSFLPRLMSGKIRVN